MPTRRSRSFNKPFLRYEFPYVKFHGRYYPLIPVGLRRGRYKVNTFGLLDSGASISIFRPEIAKALRIPMTKKNTVRMNTPVGGVDIEISRVELAVKKSRFSAGIGFSKHYAGNFNIIGREGFFQNFSICFNEIMKTVVVVPLKGLPR